MELAAPPAPGTAGLLGVPSHVRNWHEAILQPARYERTMLIQARELFRFWPITDGCFKVQELFLRQRNPLRWYSQLYASEGLCSEPPRRRVRTRSSLADVLKRLRQQSFERHSGKFASIRLIVIGQSSSPHLVHRDRVAGDFHCAVDKSRYRSRLLTQLLEGRIIRCRIGQQAPPMFGSREWGGRESVSRQ